MRKQRKICVVTGSRAEYGLLAPLMREIANDPDLKLQLIVAGMHLSPEFGQSCLEVERDGFTIDANVDMLLSSDSPVAIGKSVGLGVIGFADTLDRLKPDIMVILGDRFEIFAAAQAAMLLCIPIAHIHGGEITEMAIDDAIRHAITKMSHLHFTAAAQYRQRVIQLGESPQRVFDVGALGLDNLARLQLLGLPELEETLAFHLAPGPLFLCTYHPETLSQDALSARVRELFAALDRHPDARVVFTKANADTGGRLINQMIDEYVAANSGRMAAFVSLGQLRYLSLLKLADVVVGNSSSGIFEAPAVGTPTVNIGGRQRGRLRALSVIDCGDSADTISAALEQALSPAFKSKASQVATPFGDGKAAGRIKRVLKETPLAGLLLKHFHDVPGEA